MTIEEITNLIASSTITEVKTGLVALFDEILQNGPITDEVEIGKLVRLRSKIEIEL